MKKTLCLFMILMFALSATVFAQRAIPPGKLARNMASVELFTPKGDFELGENVQFTLRVTQAPLSLQQSYFTIEKLVATDTWVEFYRSQANPFEQGFMSPNTEQAFGWDQTNTRGDRTADTGTWRVKVFLAGGGGTGTPLMAAFNLVPSANRGGGGGGALTIKCMRNKLRLGETVVFRLENVGGGQADLTGCYYVIERRKNNRWLEWLTTPTDPLSIRGLNPGQIYKWDWNQTDGRGHRTEPGPWRIVFYAPRVPGTPVAHEFSIF